MAKAKAKAVVKKPTVEKSAKKANPDYPEFIELPYALAHKASRSDRRIRLALRDQVAKHKKGLKSKK